MITLQKAMNTLDAMQEDYEGGDYPDQEEALKLGIEALKWRKVVIEAGFKPSPLLLPGETDK